jgi:hypothetical protein
MLIGRAAVHPSLDELFPVGLRPDLTAAAANRRIAIGPVKAATGEQAHRLAVTAHDHPVAVVFDFVHPAGTAWRLVAAGYQMLTTGLIWTSPRRRQTGSFINDFRMVPRGGIEPPTP